MPEFRRPDRRVAALREGERVVMGPADPEALADAAEELRDRTMHLEPDEPVGMRPRVWALIGTVVVLAGLIIVYRHHVKWLLGLI